MASEDFNSASSLSQVTCTAGQAFFGAVRAGNLPLVADILTRYPEAIQWREIRDDIQCFDAYGLHIAAAKGWSNIAQALVEAGANVNA
jgi:hypothetical protein